MQPRQTRSRSPRACSRRTTSSCVPAATRRAVAGPGEIRRRLIELLLDALDDPERGDVIELVVGEGVVTAGSHELRF